MDDQDKTKDDLIAELRELHSRLAELEISSAASRQAAESLLESEEKFRSIYSQSPVGIELYDAGGRLIEVNPACLELFGLSDPQDVRGFDLFADPNIPANAMEQLARGETVVFDSVFDFELVKRKNLYKTSKSGQCFINCLITPLSRHGESPLGYLVHVRDITEKKQAEEQIRESHARLEATLNALPDLMFEVDRQGRILDFRAPRPELLYAPAEYFLGKTIHEALPEEAVRIIRAALEQAGRQGVSFGREYSLVLPGGVTWFELSLAAKGDPAAPGARFIVLAREITRRKQSEEALREANELLRLRIADIENLQTELREQALHDPLTGLFNRRYLVETMKREFARVAREKLPLSVIVMDVDHFKRINDTHGHQVGDLFLAAIADLIRRLTRTSDIACRYGGEEFLLVMPGSSLKTAASRAEQIRLECEGIRIPHDGQELSVTVSFGVATYPVHGEEAQEIVVKADKALYRSKQRGRNCVTVWGRGLT